MAEQTHSKKGVYVQSDKSAFTLTIHRFRANTGKRRTSSGERGEPHPAEAGTCIRSSPFPHPRYRTGCARQAECGKRRRRSAAFFAEKRSGVRLSHHDGRSRGDGRQTGAMESTAASRKSSLPLFPVEPESVKIQTHLPETHKPTPRGVHFPPHCTKHSIGSVSTHTETLRICQVPFVRKAEKRGFREEETAKTHFFFLFALPFAFCDV